ncbi:DUF1885 family protein [Alkalihalobacillus sp. TS-13]|uniref:DUF1885 family protein n=1 Tax=Alkalihalobacillus sp. TS-13 TaxID=2842455 RepID=UPI001C8851F3|nr:DUF1885 family protein [Alkalihalobacillus sp. TS-13]
MSSSAYIKLVAKSKQQTITLEEIEKLIHYYMEITNKTGEQLNWEYGSAAFPYMIEQRKNGGKTYYFLKGNTQGYNYMLVGTGQDDEGSENTYIQIVLPEGSTHGDKGKANEFSKFLAKKLNGELHLFNGRIMYYYKR